MKVALNTITLTLALAGIIPPHFMHVPSKSLCLSHFCFRMVATGIVYVATDCYTCIIAHFSTKYSLYRVENGERSQVILIWYCIQKEFNFVLLYRSLNFFLKDIFWPLCCLFFFDIRILITSLVSSNSSSKTFQPPLWGSSWSDGSWIYNYLCNQCLSPLRL